MQQRDVMHNAQNGIVMLCLGALTQMRPQADLYDLDLDPRQSPDRLTCKT